MLKYQHVNLQGHYFYGKVTGRWQLHAPPWKWREPTAEELAYWKYRCASDWKCRTYGPMVSETTPMDPRYGYYLYSGRLGTHVWPQHLRNNRNGLKTCRAHVPKTARPSNQDLLDASGLSGVTCMMRHALQSNA